MVNLPQHQQDGLKDRMWNGERGACWASRGEHPGMVENGEQMGMLREWHQADWVEG